MRRFGRVGIVGGGIAGCTLAHALLDRGVEALVFDSAEPGSASAVAAGIMNPVSGPRLALVEGADALMAEAFSLYRRLSESSGLTLASELPLIRYLREGREIVYAEQRMRSGELDRWVERWTREQVVLRGTGRLDTQALAKCTQARLGEGAWLHQHVADEHVVVNSDGVELLGNRVDAVVLADGWRSVSRKWMQGIRFEPAKGHLLHFAAQAAELEAIQSGGVWSCPIVDGQVCAGATYEREVLTPTVDPGQVAQLRANVGTFLGRDLGSVIGLCGIRPVAADRAPVAGPLDAERRVWCMNGLGSRGGMLAPALARQLADAMLGIGEIDPRWGVSRWPSGRSGVEAGIG